MNKGGFQTKAHCPPKSTMTAITSNCSCTALLRRELRLRPESHSESKERRLKFKLSSGRTADKPSHVSINAFQFAFEVSNLSFAIFTLL